MAVYEIALNPRPEIFTVDMAGVTYRMRTHFIAAPDGGWTLDIADSEDAPIACGLPLVTGRNMLEAFDYLGLGVVALFTLTSGAPATPPTFDNLGRDGHLYFEV